MVQDISYRLDVVVQRMYASHVRGELQAPPGAVCFRQAQVGACDLGGSPVLTSHELLGTAMNYWGGEVKSWI